MPEPKTLRVSRSIRLPRRLLGRHVARFDPAVIHPSGLTAGDWVVVEKGEHAGLVGILVKRVEDVVKGQRWTRLVVDIVAPAGNTVAQYRGDPSCIRRAWIREIPQSRLIGVPRARLLALGYTD